MPGVAWVWGSPYDVLGKGCVVVVCFQGTLVHPGVCEGCAGVGYGARLGLPRDGCPGIPRGMQHAVRPRWGCPGGTQ